MALTAIQALEHPHKNSQAVKKGVALKNLGEKVVKSKVAANKWLQ